jgi:transcriptional regulator with XRE-family HTH domain
MSKLTIGRTLRRLRENAGLSVNDVGSAISRQGKTVNAWENGRGEPDITALVTLSTLFGVENLLALIAVDMYGDGAPFRPNITDAEETFLKNYRALDRFGKQTVMKVIECEAERVSFHSDDTLDDTLKIPLSRLPIFPGSNISEEAVFESVQFIKIPNTKLHKEVGFAIRVDGSGFEPRFSHGDYLLIKRQNEIGIGELGLFSVDGVVYLRGFGHSRLISVTPGLDDIIITSKHKVRCLGKLISKA